MTVEHCIPESLGGTTATSTLICANCNNNMGANIDAHLSREYEASEFLAGKSNKTKRAWVAMGDGRVRADLKVTAGERTHVTVTFDQANSRPEQFDAAIRALEEGLGKSEGFKWKFDVDLRYKPRHSRIALLRIGFLMMFRQFGYPYVLDDNLAQVREQLLNPDLEIIPGPVALDLPTVPPRINAVGIVQQPANLRSFVAVVQLKTASRTLHKAIFMPGLHSQRDVYEALRTAKQNGGSVQMTMTTFHHDLKYITDSQFVTLPDDIWWGFNRPTSAA